MLSWELSPDLATHRHDRAWVEINLNALEHNVRQIRRKLSPQTALLAVVKADAYGHGAVTIARSALQQGASWLGVATIPEGIELRKAGIKAPILLLGAINTPEEVFAVSQWRIEPTLCTPKQAWVFQETIAAQGRNRLPVHLMIDTGMSRLGVPWQQTAELGQMVTGMPQLQIASVYSHLATADSPDPTIMRLQHQRYQDAIAQLRSIGVNSSRLHFANSAATLVDSALHYNMVRVGLAMYGLYPAPHLQGTIDLQPVMQVKAKVTQVKEITAGTGVSYGYQYIADRDIRLAVVGIGYADGVPRNLSNQIEVLIRGQRVPQIGAITMDQLMLDVSRIPNLREGEVVTLLGQDGNDRIAADDWANRLGTISWEILCSFKHRLPRIAIGSASERQPEVSVRE